MDNLEFDIKASACSDPSTIIDAENNFWVATDSATIADEHVYDNSDDDQAPVVDFVPFLVDEIEGTISGTVVDQTSNPIADVHVIVTGTDAEDYTDSNGEYLLDGLEADFHEVSFDHNDYYDTTVAGVFVKIGSNTILDMVMQSSLCDYVPGDCDHNGTPIELGDVVAMISLFRGEWETPNICDCPQHGEDFAPEADPNGNCVAFELGDVVTEIGAYRGAAEASGCADCPPSGRLLPGEDAPLVMPRLKAKAESDYRK